ncbi:glycoside hydrolase [Mycena floridula]|nr:glycoside hydrolase [Mycena floridula]
MRLRLAAFLALSFPLAATAAAVSSTTAQTFTGIGGSGAWWPHDLGSFPDAVKQNLSNLLFSSSGLGLTSYRFNVGAGGVNVSNPVRAPETFYVSPGVYNFSKDASGVFFLTQAATLGVPDLTMFANSAPAPLTVGKTSCNSQFANGTGAAFGTFLADVAVHFRGLGVPITHISPINEPDNSFGPSPCGQEGMLVAPNQRAEVVNGLWNALSSRGLTGTVGILADESSTLSQATSEYSAWLPQVIDKVAAVVHHTYDFPTDASYASYISSTKAAFPNKVTWMSEICCGLGNADGTGIGYSEGYDPTIKNALMFSTLVFQSFLVAGEPHYDFWTLVSNQLGCSPLNNAACATTANSNGWNDGLIYYDSSYATNKNFNLYVKKQFWTYKHFGNFVKPGSQRHLITGTAPKYTMAVSSATQYFILVLNSNTTASTLTMTFPETVCGTSGFRTSATEDFATLAAPTVSGSTWSLSLSAMSLTTYVFKRSAC